MKKRRVGFFLALALLLTTGARAQFALRSSLSGIVTDPSSAVVPNVTVTLNDVDRGQAYTAHTNDTGLYTVSDLTPGRYQAAVERQGFQRLVSAVVTLASGQTARLDLQLRMETAAQTVEVSGAASLMQTEQSVVGQDIGRDLVDSLPVVGRNFTELGALSEGISTFPRSDTGTTWQVGAMNAVAGMDFVSGGGGDMGFYLNGMNVNDNYMGGISSEPSIEAIGEVKVDAVNFSAATGRDLTTLMVVTRGGTSKYHGTLFEANQNGALKAWNPYSEMVAAPGEKKPVLSRNQYGGNFGGPVFVPKLFHSRNRVFFFVNYEGDKERDGAADNLVRVPTAAERQGNFSDLLTRFPGDQNYMLWDPNSTVINSAGLTQRTPFPNNMIPVNAVAQQVLNLYPLPNGYTNPSNPQDTHNYRTYEAGGFNNWRVDARGDLRITQNDNVYVTLGMSSGSTDNRGTIFPQWLNNEPDKSEMLTANYARVFSSHVTNEMVFGIGVGELWNYDSSVRNSVGKSTALSQPFQNYSFGRDPGMFEFNFTNNTTTSYPTMGVDYIWRDRNPTWQLSDNLSWIKGSHALKIGGVYFFKQEFDFMDTRDASFDYTMTRSGSAQGHVGGDGIASFLLGIPTTINQMYQFTGGQPNQIEDMNYWGAYIDDTWTVSRRLTLSLGLRYDLPIPLYCPDKYGNAAINTSVPGWELAIPGISPGYPLHYTPAAKKDFAPRASLAYQVNKDMVARASYGIFYADGVNTSGSYMINNSMDSTAGYVVNTYNSARYGVNNDTPSLTLSQIFPAPVTFALGTYPISTGPGMGYFSSPTSVAVNDKQSGTTPYYQRYMVQLQRKIGSNSVLSVDYVGGRGTKLPYEENINEAPYQAGWLSTAQLNAARPNNVGYFTDVFVLRHGENSFYNSATAKFQQPLSHGLQVVAFYTFSKTVSDYPWYFQRDITFNNAYWEYHRNDGRGELLYSHPNRFTTALTYQTPWGRSLAPLGRTFLWGWNVNSIVTMESGNADTVFNAQTSANDQEPDMPNVSCNPNLSRGARTPEMYFNTQCFSAPPLNVKGDAGVGTVRGPGVNNFNTSFNKKFQPKESWRVEFRADLLNTFNHPQWSSINTTYSSAAGNTFGWVNGAREPRTVMFTLKLGF